MSGPDEYDARDDDLKEGYKRYVDGLTITEATFRLVELIGLEGMKKIILESDPTGVDDFSYQDIRDSL